MFNFDCIFRMHKRCMDCCVSEVIVGLVFGLVVSESHADAFKFSHALLQENVAHDHVFLLIY